MGRLDDIDLSLKLSRDDEAARLTAGQFRLQQLRLQLGGQTSDGRLGPPLCVVFEGWDASGKGGAIRRLVTHLDPRHFRVTSYSAPTHDEKRHHYLWRFWPALPGWGGLAVLDRSWYGRVLVERVEGYATEEQWGRAYDEIKHFERMLTADGMILVKLFLHISEAEQLRRFRRREKDPLKVWKITDEDWRNRGRRTEYVGAIDDMLARTDVKSAPWHLIPGDSKRFARVAALETVISETERGMRERGFEPVPP
ncbi:MAG TPA: UDP-galactose-lipid carrier transferase [Solirubrobacteraceae bacterium]|nr:UDP-galactose-lipid carrier transferase [Solirubrobacteraceae bacterium]